MTTPADSPGVLLTDPAELLLRQVHHTWLHPQTGRVTSLAFQLYPKDKGLVSTRREAAGAQAAHDEWVEKLGAEASVGTWAVSVGEVEGLNHHAYDDSHLPENPADHASIDFRSTEKQKQVASRLSAKAAERGAVYRGAPCACHPAAP